MPTAPRKLDVSTEDLANLRESGLNDQTIRENGLRTEGNKLVFPYRNLEGEVNCFFRWRPHDGKPHKYMQAKGTPLHVFIPAASVERLKVKGEPIFITEGEKKAMALAQAGYAAIGLCGVDSWGKDKDLLDDLATLAQTGATFYVVFDYDEKQTTQENVRRAKRSLAKALRDAGAGEVFDVELPPGPDGSKQGVDDYLLSSGKAGLKKIMVQLAQECAGVEKDGQAGSHWSYIQQAPGERPACPQVYFTMPWGFEAIGM